MSESRLIRVLPFALLGIIAISLAVATIVEKQYGSEVAHGQIYTSWWMCALWGAAVVTGLLSIIQKLKSSRTQTLKTSRTCLFLLHLSLVIILAGALVTHLTSERGYIHLRSSEATCTYYTPKREVRPLPFYLCLDSFQIEAGADGEMYDFVSHVLLRSTRGDERLRISMNKPLSEAGYRIYQTSYDDDLQGSLFTVTYDPWGTGITYLGYSLLALSMVLARPFRLRSGLAPRKKRLGPIPVIIGVIFASYMVIALLARPLMPVLRSPMLVVHVGTIMISYCLLVISIFRRQVLRLAVMTLAAGIFLGAVWANLSWGTYWSWDPKESWALITLIVYALPLHAESLPWFRSERHYRFYSILAFLCLLMTYFGVNYLLGGMHAYVN